MTGDPHPELGTFQSLPNQTATPDLTELQPKKLISFRIVSVKYHSYKQRPIRETPEEKKKCVGGGGGVLQPPFRQNKRNRKVDNARAMPFLARKSGLNHSHPSFPPKNIRDLSEITRASKSLWTSSFPCFGKCFKTSISKQTNNFKGSLAQVALDLKVPPSSPKGDGLDRLELVSLLDSAKALQKWGRGRREGTSKEKWHPLRTLACCPKEMILGGGNSL